MNDSQLQGPQLASSRRNYSWILRHYYVNYDEAAIWLNHALDADPSHPNALLDLAECFELGLGVPRDQYKASQLRQKAAPNVDYFIQKNREFLGDLYVDQAGPGLVKTPENGNVDKDGKENFDQRSAGNGQDELKDDTDVDKVEREPSDPSSAGNVQDELKDGTNVDKVEKEPSDPGSAGNVQDEFEDDTNVSKIDEPSDPASASETVIQEKIVDGFQTTVDQEGKQESSGTALLLSGNRVTHSQYENGNLISSRTEFESMILEQEGRMVKYATSANASHKKPKCCPCMIQ